MKTFFLVVTFFFSVSLYAFEVPEKLLSLIPPGQEEITFQGLDGQTKCKVRVKNASYGFTIDAYYTDQDGKFDWHDVARFAIDHAHELWDFWSYSNGEIQAVSRHFSGLGSTYDTRTFLDISYEGEILKHINVNFQRKGTLWGFNTKENVYCDIQG